MTSDPLLIYGASGFTGRLIVDAAIARGLRPILGGRSPAPLEAVASSYRLESRVAELTDSAAVARLLKDVTVAMLTAGPFSATAQPMVDACLKSGVHYLDVTGECAVLERLASRSGEALRRRCMLMPGCGFDVVASDCLARHVAARLRHAHRLAIGIAGLKFPTRGSWRTMVEQGGVPVRVRRGGRLTSVPLMSMRRRFDFGCGERWSSALTWGDVVSAFHTTGIPNVEVYFEETAMVRGVLLAGRMFGPLIQQPLAQACLKAQAELLPEGPSAAEQTLAKCVIVAEAETHAGVRVASRLRTPEAYAFTAQTAAAIAGAVLGGDVEAGFQTPARVYGADFVLRFDGVVREDLGERLSSHAAGLERADLRVPLG